MQIRRYKPEDADTLWQLVFNTVHLVNIRDYTREQVDAWAPEEYNTAWWKQELSEKMPLILHQGYDIFGYADIQKNGHINHFFVAHDAQRQGKGTILLNALIDKAQEMGLEAMSVEASITARPFFERHGFIVLKEETDAYLRGQLFHIYHMKKELAIA